MGDDRVERARLVEKFDEALLAALDHRGEPVEPVEKRLAAVEHTDVMEGRVAARFELAHLAERALEVGK